MEKKFQYVDIVDNIIIVENNNNKLNKIKYDNLLVLIKKNYSIIAINSPTILKFFYSRVYQTA